MTEQTPDPNRVEPVEVPVETEGELADEETQEHDTQSAASDDDTTTNVDADEVEVESDDDRATNVEGDVNVNVTGQDTGGA